MKKILVLFGIIFILCSITMGWLLNDIYSYYIYQKEFNGLFLTNYNYSSARDKAYHLDQGGDWVCINVRGMNYNDCVEISQHECAHELFAELCETNSSICKTTQEIINEETRNDT